MSYLFENSVEISNVIHNMNNVEHFLYFFLLIFIIVLAISFQLCWSSSIVSKLYLQYKHDIK